jgi:pyridoxamine 5'-phosphate oxidase
LYGRQIAAYKPVKTQRLQQMELSFNSLKEFDTGQSPLQLFATWLAEAEKTEINDANAMTLATVDGSGLPNARVVLLKGYGEDGFVFYTNYESAKGLELLGSGKAALCFHWKSLRRQVRLRGTVEQVSTAEADAYYATRPRGSQIGAWASKQSRPVESRAALEAAVARVETQFESQIPPRPPHWSGFRLMPQEIEFWQEREFRLHDRFVFRRDNAGAWQVTRLYP